MITDKKDKPMNKTYNNVAGMLKGIGVESSFVKDVEKEIASHSIARTLSGLRCKEGLNQKELAQKMGVSQSKVSRIEGAKDLDICMGDMITYTKALNFNIEIGIRPSKRSCIERIKYYAFKTQEALNKLIHIAKGDRP